MGRLTFSALKYTCAHIFAFCEGCPLLRGFQSELLVREGNTGNLGQGLKRWSEKAMRVIWDKVEMGVIFVFCSFGSGGCWRSDKERWLRNLRPRQREPMKNSVAIKCGLLLIYAGQCYLGW